MARKWTPAQRAKFLETMAAKKMEQKTNGGAHPPPRRPVLRDEALIVQTKLATMDRMIDLFNRILNEDDK